MRERIRAGIRLASGGAMLAGSVLAGVLWDTVGAPASFLAGAAFTVVAAAALALWPRDAT